MENASKALLIAGAILIVIAIIAIGVGIVSKTRGTIDVAGQQIDSMTVQMHNKQFEQFNKERITGKEAKELVAQVLVNNDKTNNELYKVTLELTTYKNGSRYNDIFIHSASNVDDNEYDSYQNGTEDLEVDSSSITYAGYYSCNITYDSNGIIKVFTLSGNL